MQKPTIDRSVVADSPRFVGDLPKVQIIDTLLEPGLRIETAIPANPMLVEVLIRLHELKALEVNWDSYGAVAVDPRVFRPAISLIIEAIQRCQLPTIVPLPDGGLGLRWDGDESSLEIDLAPDGTIEAFAEGDHFDGVIEIEPGAHIREAEDLIRRYCRA